MSISGAPQCGFRVGSILIRGRLGANRSSCYFTTIGIYSFTFAFANSRLSYCVCGVLSKCALEEVGSLLVEELELLFVLRIAQVCACASESMADGFKVVEGVL